jgi:CheY-like chemotaxis protein
MSPPRDDPTADRGAALTVLVGVPDAEQRRRVSALLRQEGHIVVEATDAGEMRARLDELAAGDRGAPDAIVCAGLLSERDDPHLATRLAEPAIARALILLPSGGMLATASRAQRLGASAVLPDVPALARLRELLARG